MFSRTFWFTTGAAAGVWATAKAQRKLRALAPDAFAVRAADRVVAGGHRLRHFALDVRSGMAQREAELNDALGLTAGADGPASREFALPAARHDLGNSRPHERDPHYPCPHGYPCDCPHDRKEDH